MSGSSTTTDAAATAGSPSTAAAIRDGWFYTGDLVCRNADGWYSFIARKKDIIRRRGENIAGAEIDRVIQEHPGVHEVAAVPVPSELGEDEILVAVVAKPGVVTLIFVAVTIRFAV